MKRNMISAMLSVEARERCKSGTLLWTGPHGDCERRGLNIRTGIRTG
jgi:hypothetical protein